MQLATCESPIGRLGLTVCYDLRFPELYQRLAFDLGAQVLLVPSAFTKLTGLYRSVIIQYNHHCFLRQREFESYLPDTGLAAN